MNRSFRGFLRALEQACALLPEHPEEISDDDAVWILCQIRELSESGTFYRCLGKAQAVLWRQAQERQRQLSTELPTAKANPGAI